MILAIDLTIIEDRPGRVETKVACALPPKRMSLLLSPFRKSLPVLPSIPSIQLKDAVAQSVQSLRTA